MKSFLLVVLMAALAIPPLSGQKSIKPPVLVKKVEADYGTFTNGFYVNFTMVDLTIDSHGIPTALAAKNGSLPAAAVKALAGWVYESATESGKAVPFTVHLIVPVRIALTGRIARPFARQWRVRTEELRDQLKISAALNRAGVSKLEDQIKVKPDDLGVRSILLASYAKEGSGTDAPDRASGRLRHIAWLAENHPEAEILASPMALINVDSGPLADAEGYRMVRQIWLNQLEKYPNRSDVLAHAVNFLRLADFAKTEELLTAARGRHRMSQIWLGDLYGLAVLGVTGLDLKSGLPASSKPYVQYTSKARVMLAQNDDAKVVLSALASLIDGARSLQRSGQALPAYPAICETMLEHARALYPAVSETCESDHSLPEVKPAGPVMPTGIRVGSVMQSAKVVSQPRPNYRGAARKASGTVRFDITIGKEGRVDRADFVSGPLALYEAARDAVLQWKYEPTTLNGDAVEVFSEVYIN